MQSSNEALASDLTTARDDLARDLAVVRGSAQGAHPEAVMRAPNASEPVTLGELMDNPAEAMARIGTLVKRDVSDPKLWLQVAAAYFGPKALNTVMPNFGTATIQAMRAGTQAVARPFRSIAGSEIAPDLVGIASPRLANVLRAAQRFQGAPAAEPASVAPPAPAPVAPATAPPRGPSLNDALAARPAVPATPAPSPARPPMTVEQLPEAWRQFAGTPPAETPPTAKTVNQVLSTASSAKVKLSASEVLEGARLVQAGKTPAEALQTIQDVRAFTTRFQTPTNKEVSATVAAKNARTTPAKGGTKEE